MTGEWPSRFSLVAAIMECVNWDMSEACWMYLVVCAERRVNCLDGLDEDVLGKKGIASTRMEAVMSASKPMTWMTCIGNAKWTYRVGEEGELLHS